MPTVFRYKIYSISDDSEKTSANYATQEAIDRFKAIRISETAIDVSPIEINGEGIYIRNHKQKNKRQD